MNESINPHDIQCQCLYQKANRLHHIYTIQQVPQYDFNAHSHLKPHSSLRQNINSESIRNMLIMRPQTPLLLLLWVTSASANRAERLLGEPCNSTVKMKTVAARGHQQTFLSILQLLQTHTAIHAFINGGEDECGELLNV